MPKYDFLKDYNKKNNTYDDFTLDEIIENIGYYHMTKHLKNDENSEKCGEKYNKIVKIYTEYPRNRQKIVEILTEKTDKEKEK